MEIQGKFGRLLLSLLWWQYWYMVSVTLHWNQQMPDLILFWYNFLKNLFGRFIVSIQSYVGKPFHVVKGGKAREIISLRVAYIVCCVKRL